ncbi:MAG: M48 family metallopeptidase [Deltaproteobacteria bacterium]
MERKLIVIFLILFCGRLLVRYLLQQLNIRNLHRHGKEIPKVFEGHIDVAILNRMVDYTSDLSRLQSEENLASDITELAVVLLLLPVLVGWLLGIHLHPIGQALFFFAILALISGLAGLPFEIRRTFVLERKSGFSNMTWKLWLMDLAKSVILSAILMGLIVVALMGFVIYLPNHWWFWGWMFFTVFQLLLLWIYPVLIAPIFNKFEPIQDEALKEKIMDMLSKAGLEANGIYQVDEGKRSKHTNAYFTGVGKTRRIVLYDTLLSSHMPEEIVSILAHEIGHWKKKHILKQLVFMISASFVLFYAIFQVVSWPTFFSAFRIGQMPVYAGFFLASLYFAAAGFFLRPIGAAITRRFEYEADRMAFDLTGSSQPMISALKRLARDNLSNLHPHPWYVLFYYSHPPLVERIEYLQTMDYKKTILGRAANARTGKDDVVNGPLSGVEASKM